MPKPSNAIVNVDATASDPPAASSAEPPKAGPRSSEAILGELRAAKAREAAARRDLAEVRARLEKAAQEASALDAELRASLEAGA